MKIDIWESSRGVQGEISFKLVSGKHEQWFKSLSRTIFTLPHDRKSQKIECLRHLINIRLKELMKELERQLEHNVIIVLEEGQCKSYPLEADWRIE